LCIVIEVMKSRVMIEIIIIYYKKIII